jgi:hypothetical protein
MSNLPNPLSSAQTSPYSGAQTEPIIDQVARFIERFVFIQDRNLYRLLAVWAIATHLYERFEYIGYVFAYSPEPQSGKSRLLEVLELLVSKPSFFVRPTEAVLFRTAGRTQLLDEVDGWTNRDELRAVLNAGFRNGGSVPRTEKGPAGDYTVVEYPVYGPRALAGIGTTILDETTRDRTFTIRMVRQVRGERRERLTRTVKKDAVLLKAAIEQWVEAHADKVAEVYEAEEFPFLEDFRDRTIDVSQPLAAVLEVAFKDNDELEIARLSLIDAIASTRKDQETCSEDHRILVALLGASERNDPLVGTATELAAQCTDLAELPNEWQVSMLLRRYGFQTKSIRKDGQPKYRYSLPRKDLAELVARYGSRKEPSVASRLASTPEPLGIAS